MKRIDRVYEYVTSQTKELKKNQLTSQSGVTTNDVAKTLDIQRSNASKDLNQLVREGIIDKIEGRPVRYVCKSVFRHQPFSKYVESYRETERRAIPTRKMTSTLYEEDIFKRVIGVNASMKNPMEQAKASILYPPKGLNCLIIGPTGSGKTYFAHTMYHFAKQNNVVEENKEFVVFNCADYASNPELLMSHLFGHVQGAFTGADQEKDGLITLADGSFLFLDEIHRLPPEGQEMIFYFMDNGTYAKLGESTKHRRADVRIICATTEDPNSTLLNTFVRRIPITIQLPNFKNRSAKEKVDLVKNMMTMEAKRIQRRIILSEDVVKSLIGSVSYGNVGQLKSNVQLVTAQAFLNQMDKNELDITMDELNDSVKQGLIHLANDRQSLTELTHLLSPHMVVSPNEQLEVYEEDSYELPYNLYDIIGDKAAVLRKDGFNQDAINHFITTDINVHLKSFYRNHGFTFDTENKLSEIIDVKVIDTTRKIYDYAMNQLQYKFQSNFMYAMGLHISSFLTRAHMGEHDQIEENENIIKMVEHYPVEHEVAKGFKQIIEKEHHVLLPPYEVNYLTVLLVSLKENHHEGRIGIVVAAHGNSTATSMVQVVSQLMGVDNLKAVDMPLEMSPKEALEKVIEEVSIVDEGSGVMLLVDMGSLGTFTEDIKERTGIDVKIVDMVTTALVLEAARKSSLIETSLDDLYESLSVFHGYHGVKTPELVEVKPEKKAIIAICASGQGTAQRMKELINDYLEKHMVKKVKVIPLSIVDFDHQLGEIQQRYDVIAITGIKRPNLDIPFISMDRLFTKDGPTQMKKLLEDTSVLDTEILLTEETAKEACHAFMSKSYTFVNPDKLLEPLWEFSERVLHHTVKNANYAYCINLTMHMSGVIERSLRDEPLTVNQAELKETIHHPQYVHARNMINEIEKSLMIDIIDDEVYFILKIVDNSRDK